MAVDVAQKIRGGDSQPNGGAGIVSIAGAKGLTGQTKLVLIILCLRRYPLHL